MSSTLRARNGRALLLAIGLSMACSRPPPAPAPVPWQVPGDVGVSAVAQNQIPRPVIAAASGGRVYAAWVEVLGSPTADTLGDRVLTVSMWDGGAWSRVGEPLALAPQGKSQDSREAIPWASIAVAPGASPAPVVAWSDKTSTPTRIAVRRWSSSEGWQQLPDPRVDPARRAGAASVTVDPASRQPVLAWEEEGSATDPRWRIYVARWDGLAWKPYVGADQQPAPVDEIFDAQVDPNSYDWAGPPTLVLDESGSPVVAFTDVWLVPGCSVANCPRRRYLAVRRWDPMRSGWGAVMKDDGLDLDARWDNRLGLAVSGPLVYAASCLGVDGVATQVYGPARVVKGDGSAVMEPVVSTTLVVQADALSCSPQLALDGSGRLVAAFDEPAIVGEPDKRFNLHVMRLGQVAGVDAWLPLGDAAALNTDLQYTAQGPALAIDEYGMPIVAWSEGIEPGPLSQVKTWRWFVHRFGE